MSDIQPVIFVIDSDKAFREHICNIVATVGMRGSPFETSQAFLESVPGARPNCLLVNSRLHGMSGLRLQSRLHDIGCQIPLIMIADAAGDVTTAVVAMKNGAADYFEKPLHDQRFLDCIQECVTSDLATEQTQILRRAAGVKYARLTPREKQVMGCCLHEMHTKEIAHALKVSVKTIEAHRAVVMKKMGARSLISLVSDARLLNLN